MKQLPLLLLFFYFLGGSATAQSKTEFGITAEGSWFIPGAFDSYSPPNKNGFGAGIGTYASKNLIGKLSGDIGISYRIKQMREYYEPVSDYENYGGYSPYGYGYSPYGYGYGTNYTYDETAPAGGWKNYPLNYLVVPVHLQFTAYKNIFVKGGIEASWLTNYNTRDHKTEFNWIIGFGGKTNKLKYSISYICGFKSVAFENKLWVISDKLKSATAYRNNMIQLSLSYPLWQKK